MRHQLTSEERRRGGRRCVERHGSSHMASIGAIGFAVTVSRHWNGDKEAYVEHLRESGQLKTCDREFRSMVELYQQYLPELFGQD